MMALQKMKVNIRYERSRFRKVDDLLGDAASHKAALKNVILGPNS